MWRQFQRRSIPVLLRRVKVWGRTDAGEAVGGLQLAWGTRSDDAAKCRRAPTFALTDGQRETIGGSHGLTTSRSGGSTIGVRLGPTRSPPGVPDLDAGATARRPRLTDYFEARRQRKMVLGRQVADGEVRAERIVLLNRFEPSEDETRRELDSSVIGGSAGRGDDNPRALGDTTSDDWWNERGTPVGAPLSFQRSF